MLSKTKFFLYLIPFCLISLPLVAQAAPQVSLTASQGVAYRSNDPTTLTWNVSGASTCTLDGATVSATSGSQVVSPRYDTTYVLRCSDVGGAFQSASVKIEVIPIISFSASPETINTPGGGVTNLTWSSDGDHCIDEAGNSIPTSGSVEKIVLTTKTFSIECYVNGGARINSQSVTVLVTSGTPCLLPSSVSWGGGKCSAPGSSASKSTLYNGEDLQLNNTAPHYLGYVSLHCTNGTLNQVSPFCTPGDVSLCGNYHVDPGEQCDPGTPSLGTCPQVCSSACQLNGCPTGPPPSVNLTADGASVYGGVFGVVIKKGEPVNLRWTVSGFSSCQKDSWAGLQFGADPNWNGSLSGGALASGSLSFVPANIPGSKSNVGKHGYYMCSQSPFQAASFMVFVGDPPTIESFTAEPNPVDSGATVTLSWKASANATNCSLYRGIVGYDSRVGSSSQIILQNAPIEGKQNVTPAASNNYTVVCRSPAIDNMFPPETHVAVKTILVSVNGSQNPPADPTCTQLGGTCQDFVSCAQSNGVSVSLYNGLCGWNPSSGYFRNPTLCCVSDKVNGAACTSNGGSCQSVSSGCPSGQTEGIGKCGGGLMCCKAFNPPLDTRRRLKGLPPGTTPPVGGGIPPVVDRFLSFQNPLKFTTIPDLLSGLLSALQNIIVILAVIFIIIGAFLYITSAGNEGRMETGKKAILAALIGLALGIAAPAFLKEIGSILGWTTPASTIGTSLSLLQIAYNVLSFLLTLIGIIAIIMLVIGGMMYLTAAGSEEQIDRGKKIVKYSIIGIVIALASLVLVKQIAGFFV